ncbi:MAG: XdhC family protein [Abitibacteriaceae bacterium]|nr:XdhC family protein [Abditibacteriaceae bacterium]
MSAPVSRNNSTNNLWQSIAVEITARRSLVAVTVVRDSGSVPRRTGAKMLVYANGCTLGTVGGGLFESLVVRDSLEALAQRQSVTRVYSFNPKGSTAQAFGAICGGRAEMFLEVIMPPDRLLIVGGGHCGRALAHAATLLDFSIILADDRAEYAQPSDYQLPNVESVLHLPADFSGLPAPDAQTYVILVSKGFMTDEAALRRVLDTPAAYIGMIGSKRKREVVFNNLRADGVAEEKLARVHAPIGLEIGAETPEEIAISILAEVIQVRAQRRPKTSLTQKPQADDDVAI